MQLAFTTHDSENEWYNVCMSRMQIGVLRGGASQGYASSLRTGATILQTLPEDRYNARDIFIDRVGVWHVRGIPTAPMRALSGVDVVVNALYNDGMGHHGDVARTLKQASIPYTGTRGATASLAANRTWVRGALAGAGIPMPHAYGFSVNDVLDAASMAQRVFSRFGPPYVVKPLATGTAIGIRVVPTLQDLPDALADILDLYGTALVEEYVYGPHVSVGVIEDFRNESLYTLPPAKFMLPQGVIIADFDARLHEETRHTCPWNPEMDDKQLLLTTARLAHKALGLSHYSRADFIMRGRKPFLVGVTAFPELHEGSAFTTMLDSVGTSLPLFLDHIIQRAHA